MGQHVLIALVATATLVILVGKPMLVVLLTM